MTRRVFGTLVLWAAVTTGPAQSSDGEGGYAGSFFRISVGARPTAMGGAYVAVSDDGAAPLFNPAGLADLQRPLFGTSYRSLALDRKMGYVTVMFPARGNSAIGVNWLYAGSGEVEARDHNGRPLGRSVAWHNHAFSALFTKRFEDYVSAGLKAAYLHSEFAEMTAYSVGLDVGLLFYIDQLFDREKRLSLPVQDMRLGVVLRHLAASYRWDNADYLAVYRSSSALSSEQDDPVPLELDIGASARLLNRRLLIATDARLATVKVDSSMAGSGDGQSNAGRRWLGPFLHAGAEYLLSEQLALRAGYSDRRFTAGTGYLFALGSQRLAIDYAFSTGKVDEGSEHIFSFDLLF